MFREALKSERHMELLGVEPQQSGTAPVKRAADLQCELWAEHINENRLLSQTLTTRKYKGSTLFGAKRVQRILRMKIRIN